MAEPRSAHVIHLAEAAIWALLVLLAFVAMLTTLGSSFPARGRALCGEAVVLAAGLLLLALASRRVQRQAGASLVQLGFALLRVLVGIPLSLFALLLSAAGFAA